MWDFVSGREHYVSLVKLQALISLARPFVCILGLAGVYLGYWLSIHTFDISNARCLNAAIAAALAMAYGNTMNDVLDHEIDALIYPLRPIPAGQVTWQEGLFSGGILASLALLFGILSGKEIFILTVTGLLLVTLYNVWVKQLQLLGNLLIAGISIIPGLMGNQIAEKGFLPSDLVIALILFVLGREIYRTIHDAPGDLISGRQTIFMMLGRGKTELAAFLLGLVGTILLWLDPLSSNARHATLYRGNVTVIFVILIFIGSFISYNLKHRLLPPYYDTLLTFLMRSVFCLVCISLLWLI